MILRHLDTSTRYYFIFIFLLSFCLLNNTSLFAQDILIKGQITDKHLGEPIPFANIYVLNTPILGTSSDFEGNYELLLKEKPDSLAASALGYVLKKVAYQNEEVLDLKLETAAYNLEAIVVRPKKNPALAIVRKILANKKQNNPRNLEQYQCEIYDKLELDLVNVSEGFQNFIINRPFKFAFTKIDSTSEDAPFLPAFLIETLSDYYYIRRPKRTQEIVKATKVSGLKNASISQFLDILYENVNIYDNWIPILTKQFVSPISDAAFTYYNYYLVDSASIDNKPYYQIQFFPKSKNSNTFQGDFWVNDSDYAIKRINLKLFENADLNFVNQISMMQNFDYWQDSIWVPQEDFTIVTFDNIAEPLLLNNFSQKIKENAPSIQGKRMTSYRQYQFDLTAASIPRPNSNLSVESLTKDEEYWTENRHIDLTPTEKLAEHIIDTIQELKAFRTWRTLTTLLFTGYVPLGIFDIGNVYSFYNQMPIEGNRYKIGLRTNARLNKRFLLATYGAYGTEDKRFKFGVNALYLFNKQPRQSLSATVIKDIDRKYQFNTNFSLSSDGILASNIVRRGEIPLKLMDIRHYNLTYYRENILGLSFQAVLEHQYTAPYFDFQYQTVDEELVNDFRYTALGLKLRFAYQEKFLAGVFNRVTLNSRAPIISFNYKMGIKGALKGDFNFHHFEFDFYDRLDIPPFGYAKININAGKIFGRLPYFLLYVPKGNEGIFSNYDGFNLVNEFAFAADAYTRFSIDYHLDGLFLKRVPLIKKLDWRTALNFRLLSGNIRAENRIANALSFSEHTTETDWVRLQVPNTKPYMEVSAGIENIFHVLRIDVSWKLNYQQIGIPNWGIRGNVHIKF